MIIVDEIVSADGLVDSVGQADRMPGVAAVLLGAQTYREFSAYWPMQDPTSYVNALPKHVISRSLPAAPWGDLPAAAVERDDPATVARRLHERYDGDIIVWGSLTLATSLFAAGLVDELWLRVVPVALGTGRGFLPAQDIAFSAVEAVGHPGGWSTLRYQVDRRPLP